MELQPLLEFDQLEIDYVVAPLFPLDQVAALRAFVIRLSGEEVHLALAMDIEAEMRGKDFVGVPLPHSTAVEMARRLSGRSEVILYQVSERALTTFLKEAGRRAMTVLDKIF